MTSFRKELKDRIASQRLEASRTLAQIINDEKLTDRQRVQMMKQFKNQITQLLTNYDNLVEKLETNISIALMGHVPADEQAEHINLKIERRGGWFEVTERSGHRGQFGAVREAMKRVHELYPDGGANVQLIGFTVADMKEVGMFPKRLKLSGSVVEIPLREEDRI